MNNKTLKRYTYEGFGFPVVLCNVPAKKIRGEWIPFIDYNELARCVLRFLCGVDEPLTGSQVFFIRQQIKLTGDHLADLLGVSQAAVSKWETKKDEIAKMEPAIEFCLRLIALEYLKDGSSDSLRKIFLERHLLGIIKEKLKNKEFSPTPVELKDNTVNESFYLAKGLATHAA